MVIIHALYFGDPQANSYKFIINRSSLRFVNLFSQEKAFFSK